MKSYLIQLTYGHQTVSNGIPGGRVERDGFVALVYGDTEPDPKLIQILQETGGSWNNRVKWCRMRQAYLVTGIDDPDPDWGDTGSAIDRRVRQAVGNWRVSIAITHEDGSTFHEGSLEQAMFEDHLADTGQLN